MRNELKKNAFVANFLKCANGSLAARQVGVSEKSARRVASRWLKLPEVKKALEDARSALQAEARYNYEKAMAECLDCMNFAKEKGDSSAFCKAIELRAKLSGLLVERQQIHTTGFQININGLDDKLLMKGG